MKSSIKAKKVFAMIGIFLLIIAISFVSCQLKNIKVLYSTLKYSRAELEERIEKDKKATEDVLREKYNINIKDISAEDEEKLRKGEIGEEELNKIFNVTPKEDVPPPAEDKDEEAQKIIGQQIGSLYSLKALYMSKLSDLEKQALDEYKSISEEGRGKKAKESLILSYMSIAVDMEKQCDMEVDRILSALTEELKAQGEDTSMVKVLRDYYENEKVLKKSQYLKKFGFFGN